MNALINGTYNALIVALILAYSVNLDIWAGIE